MADPLHPYRSDWPEGVVFDDFLYCQAIGVGRYMIDCRRPLFHGGEMIPDDQAMYEFLSWGIWDQRPCDRALDASTRSIRYSAILADRLWSMIEDERNRVGVLLNLAFLLY